MTPAGSGKHAENRTNSRQPPKSNLLINEWYFVNNLGAKRKLLMEITHLPIYTSTHPRATGDNRRNTSHGARATSHEPLVTGHERRATKCPLRLKFFVFLRASSWSNIIHVPCARESGYPRLKKP